ncbi:PIN domain-containing protein [Rhodococcus zopfii]|uniref:PIN domain-containing protein n=1 Tax=Rhodococcus zopfii TaxID=43772 RepID=UPI0009334F3B|nr:PIN domain-containing protein [Rhodococcus zopfii]
MSTSIVILDTNILAHSPFLDSDEWNQLHVHTTDWGLRFMVPEVAVMETVNVVRRNWKPDITRLEQHSRWISRLGKSAEFQAVLDAAAERSDRYDSSLRCRMEELGIEIAPLPATIDHLDIARRASERRAPYGTAGNGKEEHLKDGYRDTLIWLTVLAVAENHPACDVWFVSDNYSDFGGKSENRDSRDVSDYPLAWHSQLTPDLASKGLTDRVFYARGLRRLEEHLLAKYAPLPDAERDELWAAVERSELDRQLMLALFGAPVDPRAGALPLDTLSAWITSCVRAADSVRFTEAARRAANAWTARFDCVVEATIEVTSTSGDVAEESKPLVIVGRIDVNGQNEVTALAIDAIDAAADDPQRRAWERADSAMTRYEKVMGGVDVPPGYLQKVMGGVDVPPGYLQKVMGGVDVPPGYLQKVMGGVDVPPGYLQKLMGDIDSPPVDHATSGSTSDEPEEPDDSPDAEPEN